MPFIDPFEQKPEAGFIDPFEAKPEAPAPSAPQAPKPGIPMLSSHVPTPPLSSHAAPVPTIGGRLKRSIGNVERWAGAETPESTGTGDFLGRVAGTSVLKNVAGMGLAAKDITEETIRNPLAGPGRAIVKAVPGWLRGTAVSMGLRPPEEETPSGPARDYGVGLPSSLEQHEARLKHQVRTNPVGVIMAATGLKGAEKAGPEIAKSFAPKPNIDKLVATTYEKAVRPSVAGKGTSGQIEKATERVSRGVKKIVELKDQGAIQLGEEGAKVARVPESLKEFGDSISQGKESVFKQYDNMQREAGEAGVEVAPAPAIKELSSIVADPDVQLANPKAVAHAEAWIKRLNERGPMTTESAQKVIKSMNTSLDAYYNNPTYDTAVPAYIDSLVVNHLRAGLDSAVESAKGPGYQSLKNDYGALKSIEKEVNHRTIVDARKNVKGLIDFSDVFSGAEIARGILTLDPGSFITGVAARGIRSWYKNINNPNRQIRRMFQQVDKHWDRGAGTAEAPAIKPTPGVADFEPSLRTPGEVAPAIERGQAEVSPLQYGELEIRPRFTGEAPPAEAPPAELQNLGGGIPKAPEAIPQPGRGANLIENKLSQGKGGAVYQSGYGEVNPKFDNTPPAAKTPVPTKSVSFYDLADVEKGGGELSKFVKNGTPYEVKTVTGHPTNPSMTVENLKTGAIEYVDENNFSKWYAKPAENSNIVNNASGESAASAEAISAAKSAKAQGVTYEIEKGGKSRPAIGPRPVDNALNQGETLVEIKNGKRTIIKKAEAKGESGTVHRRRLHP